MYIWIDKIEFNRSTLQALRFYEKEGLKTQKEDIDVCLSIINHILEDEEMKYQVTVKEIPAVTVYYTEVK